MHVRHLSRVSDDVLGARSPTLPKPGISSNPLDKIYKTANESITSQGRTKMLKQHPFFVQYSNILTTMNRESKTNADAQLAGIVALTSMFITDSTIDLQTMVHVIEDECSLINTVHRAIVANPKLPRISSLGLRILSHVAHASHSLKQEIIQENGLATAVAVLNQHKGDVSAVRSSLCLLTVLLNSNRSNNSTAKIKFQRIPMIGVLLNTILKDNIDDAPTVEWALAICSYVEHYGGRNLLSTICTAVSTHATDIGIIRSALSALSSLGKIPMNQHILVGSCGIFQLVRSILGESCCLLVLIFVCGLLCFLLFAYSCLFFVQMGAAACAHATNRLISYMSIFLEHRFKAGHKRCDNESMHLDHRCIDLCTRKGSIAEKQYNGGGNSKT